MAKFTYLDSKLKEITVKGHANYQKHGKDIVCAAVSTATILTANAIKHLTLDHKIDLTIDEGYFKLTLKEDDNIILSLFKNLEYALYELEKDYPKYMKNQKEG